MKRLLVVILLFVSSVNLAQEVTPEADLNFDIEGLIQADFQTNNLTPLVGEPFEIRLVVETPENVEIIQWPEFEEDWSPFMLVEIGERTMQEQNDNNMVYTQVFDVRLWQPGDHRTPDTFIQYQLEGVEQTYSVPVQVLFFTVPTVLETQDLNLLDIRPAKPPLSVLYIPPWMIVLGMTVSGGFLWWGRKKFIQWQASRPPKPGEPPVEIALHQIDKLQKSPNDEREIISKLSDILRAYLQAKNAVYRLDLTTAELIEVMKADVLMTDEQTNVLQRILEQCDLVQFTEFVPNEKLVNRLIQASVQWLNNNEVIAE